MMAATDCCDRLGAFSVASPWRLILPIVNLNEFTLTPRFFTLRSGSALVVRLDQQMHVVVLEAEVDDAEVLASRGRAHCVPDRVIATSRCRRDDPGACSHAPEDQDEQLSAQAAGEIVVAQAALNTASRKSVISGHESFLTGFVRWARLDVSPSEQRHPGPPRDGHRVTKSCTQVPSNG